MKITSFRRLETDMDARSVSPVYDQNHKKAALIKIVTSETGFDFDIGILGVTSVKQETGEIWVYVPEHSYKITIKHNQFGVIRDFVFPIEISSAVVYEMILDTIKPEAETKHVIDTIYSIREILPPVKKINLNTDAIPIIGLGATMSYGAMVGVSCKSWGGYLKYTSNFTKAEISGECKSDGSMHGGTIWTTSECLFSRYSITAGATVHFNNWIGTFAGAGYGQLLCLWQDINQDWIKVSDQSFAGISLEAGLIFNIIRHINILCGINLTSLSYPEMNIGIGYRF